MPALTPSLRILGSDTFVGGAIHPRRPCFDSARAQVPVGGHQVGQAPASAPRDKHLILLGESVAKRGFLNMRQMPLGYPGQFPMLLTSVGAVLLNRLLCSTVIEVRVRKSISPSGFARQALRELHRCCRWEESERQARLYDFMQPKASLRSSEGINIRHRRWTSAMELGSTRSLRLEPPRQTRDCVNLLKHDQEFRAAPRAACQGKFRQAFNPPLRPCQPQSRPLCAEWCS